MGPNNKSIFSEWIFWHFSETPNFLIEVWKNYLLFALNYFSLPLLLKTFLAPWKKYNWVYPKGFDVVEILNTFVSNIFSRILGAVMRSVLIVCGIIFQAFVLVAGAVVFALWMLLPLLIILGFLSIFLF